VNLSRQFRAVPMQTALSDVQEVRSRAVVRQVPLFRAECPDCGWASLTTSDRDLARTMGTRHDAACQRLSTKRAEAPAVEDL